MVERIERSIERIFTSRRYTALAAFCSLVAFVGSGLLSEMLAFFVFVYSVVLVIGCLASRHYVYEKQSGALVWLPISERDHRHNEYHRLQRHLKPLKEREDELRAFAKTIKDPHEVAHKVPVLLAEADAAKRKRDMIQGDIDRLKEGWAREDRDRRYRELTKGDER